MENMENTKAIEDLKRGVCPDCGKPLTWSRVEECPSLAMGICENGHRWVHELDCPAETHGSCLACIDRMSPAAQNKARLLLEFDRMSPVAQNEVRLLLEQGLDKPGEAGISS